MIVSENRPTHPWVAEGARRLRFAINGMFAQTPTDIVRAAVSGLTLTAPSVVVPPANGFGAHYE